jgi:hypothetical protein
MGAVVTTSTPEPIVAEPEQSPRPRRLASPRWLDPRMVAGGLIVVLGALLALRLLTSNGAASTPVWAAARALTAGTVLSADDLRSSSVHLAHGPGDYLPADAAIAGKVVNRDLAAGELVPRTALGATAAQATVTIALAPENAPNLARGQHIELWVTAGRCHGVLVLGDAVVANAVAASTSAFSTGRGQSVTLSLPPVDAARVVSASALSGAVLLAAIAPPGSSSAPPGDLMACAGSS